MKKNQFLKMAFLVVAGLTSGSLIMPNVAHADSIQSKIQLRMILVNQLKTRHQSEIHST